uniref:FAD-binding domain-containing protein n=1 Tax=Phytophthora ramorum TaxID=164328 RepID=H3H9P2_PHYRM
RDGFQSFHVQPNGRVEVTFENGTIAEGSVLVGADGTTSRVRRQYVPRATTLLDTDSGAIYGKTVLTPEIESFFETDSTTMVISKKPMMSLVMEPRCKIQADLKEFAAISDLPDVQNYICWVLIARAQYFHRNDEMTVQDLFSMTPAQVANLSNDMTRDWSPQIRAIFEHQSPEWSSFLRISTMSPEIRHWQPSTITLIGDAVHTMAPAGIGCNTALHDAQMLVKYFCEIGVGVDAIAQYEHNMRQYGSEGIAIMPEQREDNIVWAPTGVVDIHRPERWGYVFFSSEDEQPGGELELAGAMTGFLEERMTIERVLDAVYYRQRSFHALHGGFASTMEMLYAGTPPASSPVSPPGLAKSEIKVWTEAFPLCEQLRRYELDFPVLSSRSDLVVNHLAVKHPVDDLSRLAELQIAAEAGAHSTLDNGGHRRATRRYAPALDEYDEDSDTEPGAESVNEAARPPLSPRSQEMKDREARGLFSNFMVTVRSKTQEWHMTHDGRLWQTL